MAVLSRVDFDSECFHQYLVKKKKGDYAECYYRLFEYVVYILAVVIAHLDAPVLELVVCLEADVGVADRNANDVKVCCGHL